MFLVMATLAGLAALLTLAVPGPPPAGGEELTEAAHVALVRAANAIRSEQSARVLVAIICADFVALGALDVLYPHLAIEVLDQGPAWAAYLNAIFGAGAIAAVVFTVGLVGRPRLVPSMLFGVALYVGAFIFLAVNQTLALAILLLATAGLGRTIVEVSARTLLQRIAPSDMQASTRAVVATSCATPS